MNKLIAIALGAVMALSFTGCGDDDEEGSYSVAMPEAVDLGLSVKWASFNLVVGAVASMMHCITYKAISGGEESEFRLDCQVVMTVMSTM